MHQIDILNNKLLLSANEDFPIGLLSGKMGLCIYYFYLSRWEKNREFEEIAEKLLDDISNNLSDVVDITVESGLAGIAIGIHLLIEEKFIEGNINEVLEDIDNIIFKRLAFVTYKDRNKNILKLDFIHLLYYLYIRYKVQTTFDSQYIFQELIVKVIELVEYDLDSDFFCDYYSYSIRNFSLPIYMYIINHIYELNIYQNRIRKILEKHLDYIFSLYPSLQSNRLFLLAGLISIKNILPDYKERIEAQIKFLKQGIDIKYIINVEMQNQDVYIGDGVSSIYILLFYIQKYYPEYLIDYDPNSIYNKINDSEAWKALFCHEFYFNKYRKIFEGFPGAYLVLLHIQKHSL